MDKKVWKLLTLVLCIGISLTIAVRAQTIPESPTPFTLGATSGTVEVFDSSGRQMAITGSMALYSGCTVRTGSSSTAEVRLDSAKTITLGPGSAATVRASGKQYNVYLEAGQLLFNVTEHLAADESLTISAPRLAAEIRGTTGLICVDDSSQVVSQLFVFDGSVACQIYQSADSQFVKAETGTATEGQAVDLTAVSTTQPSPSPQPSLLPGAVIVGTIDPTLVDEGETVTSSSLLPIAINEDEVPEWVMAQVVGKPNSGETAGAGSSAERTAAVKAAGSQQDQVYQDSSDGGSGVYAAKYVYEITNENFSTYKSCFKDYKDASEVPSDPTVLSGLLGRNKAIAVYNNGTMEVVDLWSGSGTPAAPYQITSEQKLIFLREKISTGERFETCSFALTTDITLTRSWSNGSMADGAAFAGQFDGAGHTIRNFTCTDENSVGNGLFTANSGTIDGLNIQGTVGGTVCGGIAARNTGTIQNCSFSGTITKASTACGGLAEYNAGTIRNCYSNVTADQVESSSAVGGIAAFNSSGTIENCYAVINGTVTGTVGGVVGQNSSGTISNCFYLYKEDLKGIGGTTSDADGIQAFDANGYIHTGTAPDDNTPTLLSKLKNWAAGSSEKSLYSWAAVAGSYPVLSKTAPTPG